LLLKVPCVDGESPPLQSRAPPRGTWNDRRLGFGESREMKNATPIMPSDFLLAPSANGLQINENTKETYEKE